MMLIIPALPDASYLADGFAMISINFILAASKLFRREVTCCEFRVWNFPSSKIWTPFLPLIMIFSCPSTVTPGACLNKSRPLSPALFNIASTFSKTRSVLVCRIGIKDLITTSFRTCDFILSCLALRVSLFWATAIPIGERRNRK